ncbi:MAG: hypothetical protein FJ296_05080 [Planctomycetes bacterium]|nr:hypothetical protein [Planctomycetota bacterium]
MQRLAALPEGDARRAAEALPTARALLRAGRMPEAQPLLAAHVEAHADDNLALFELAGVEESLERLEEAQRLYGRLVERLTEDDELRPRVLDARERVAQRLAGRPAPPPPEGTQRADETTNPLAPTAGPAGTGGL